MQCSAVQCRVVSVVSCRACRVVSCTYVRSTGSVIHFGCLCGTLEGPLIQQALNGFKVCDGKTLQAFDVRANHFMVPHFQVVGGTLVGGEQILDLFLVDFKVPNVS